MERVTSAALAPVMPPNASVATARLLKIFRLIIVVSFRVTKKTTGSLHSRNRVVQITEAGDADSHLIARSQIFRRVEADADADGCASGNDVTG